MTKLLIKIKANHFLVQFNFFKYNRHNIVKSTAYWTYKFDRAFKLNLLIFLHMFLLGLATMIP